MPPYKSPCCRMCSCAVLRSADACVPAVISVPITSYYCLVFGLIVTLYDHFFGRECNAKTRFSRIHEWSLRIAICDVCTYGRSSVPPPLDLVSVYQMGGGEI